MPTTPARRRSCRGLTCRISTRRAMTIASGRGCRNRGAERSGCGGIPYAGNGARSVWCGETEMPVREQRGDTAARPALHEALLDPIRFEDVFDPLPLLTYSPWQILYAH